MPPTVQSAASSVESIMASLKAMSSCVGLAVRAEAITVSACGGAPSVASAV